MIVVIPEHAHLLFLVRIRAKNEKKNTIFGWALDRIRAKIEKKTHPFVALIRIKAKIE